MGLSRKQAKFAVMVAKLILYADSLGYHITLGDGYVYSKTGHRENSLHYEKLAQDLNLFDGNWNYLTETEAHEPLGIYWEEMGGSWGGRFKDGNHYSLSHGGRK